MENDNKKSKFTHVLITRSIKDRFVDKLADELDKSRREIVDRAVLVLAKENLNSDYLRKSVIEIMDNTFSEILSDGIDDVSDELANDIKAYKG